jgi:YesN/AraC family two-component response regulator
MISYNYVHFMLKILKTSYILLKKIHGGPYMEEILNYNNENKTFLLSYRRRESHNMPSNHFHSNYELYYLYSGERQFFIKDRTILAKQGDLVLIKPNILHKTSNSILPNHERIIINFAEKLLSNSTEPIAESFYPLFDKEYTIISFSPSDRIEVEKYFNHIIKETLKKDTAFDIYSTTLLLQLLIYCCRFLKENNTTTFQHLSPIHERISEVVRYINQNYNKELSLQFLSETFFISPYYLSRAFKEATGFTFIEYLNSLRIKEAIKLLQDTNLKVNVIVQKVGFGSITHFGRVFKEVTGHAPLYYRKHNK